MLPSLRAALLLSSTIMPSLASGQEPAEVRGVWIPNSHSTFFESRANVAEQMEILASSGINVVFPVVWSKGHTLFQSDVGKKVVGHSLDPRYGDRDPLAEVLFEAHVHGIEVIPWFEYGFAAGHERFPGEALVKHPEWAAIDQSGAPVVKNGFQWMNSLDPAVQEFMTKLVVECAERYDVDGVQGDDRLPALPAEGGYDQRTVTRYRREHRGASPPTDIHDADWIRWRADILTDYLAELRGAVKKVRPSLAFSMAPGGPSWSLRDYLQDQKTWVERGLVDALHPQLYARDLPGYEAQADGMLKIEWLGSRPGVIAPGVLGSFRDYLVSDKDALGAIQVNRERSLGGEVWFYETSLLSRNGALAETLRQGPYAEPARLPWRSESDWRPRALKATRTVESGEVVFTVTAAVAGTYVVYAQSASPESDEERWTELKTVSLRAGRRDDPTEALRVTQEDAASIARVIALVKRD